MINPFLLALILFVFIISVLAIFITLVQIANQLARIADATEKERENG